MSVGIKLTNCARVQISDTTIRGFDVAVDAANVHDLQFKELNIQSWAASGRRGNLLTGAANLATLGSFFKDAF